jgi:cytochrome c biogenesis protein CcmG/thiol:disulfide interchange protein DsbE
MITRMALGCAAVMITASCGHGNQASPGTAALSGATGTDATVSPTGASAAASTTGSAATTSTTGAATPSSTTTTPTAATTPDAAIPSIPDSQGFIKSKKNGLLAVGKTAPDFELKDVNGNRVALKDMRGKVVLLDFWATWCGPCVETTPILEGMHRRTYDKGLRVVGISIDDPTTAGNVVDFVHQNSVTYPVAATPYKDYQVSLKYKVVSLPSLVLVDKKGVIRWTQVGYAENEWMVMEHNIKRLLDES